MTVRRPATKARWIDGVTKYGETVTAKQILRKIHKEYADEVDGDVIAVQSIGSILAYHLGHKFIKHAGTGKITRWEKIAV